MRPLDGLGDHLTILVKYLLLLENHNILMLGSLQTNFFPGFNLFLLRSSFEKFSRIIFQTHHII